MYRTAKALVFKYKLVVHVFTLRFYGSLAEERPICRRTRWSLFLKAIGVALLGDLEEERTSELVAG